MNTKIIMKVYGTSKDGISKTMVTHKTPLD